MTPTRKPTDHEYRLARARVCRELVREGSLDGPLALSHTVWPSAVTQGVERLVNRTTIAARAFSIKLNR